MYIKTRGAVASSESVSIIFAKAYVGKEQIERILAPWLVKKCVLGRLSWSRNFPNGDRVYLI